MAENGQEAVELATKLRPAVVLMDLKMPKMDGVQATRAIRQNEPDIAVLVLTTYATDDWISDALRAGAAGYLLKDTRRDDLVRAIEGTVAGQTFLDPSVAGAVIAQAINQQSTVPNYDLTEREREILTLLAQGMSNPQIGRNLHLSAGTVRNYLSNLFAKLGVTDRTQAAVIAARMGLV